QASYRVSRLLEELDPLRLEIAARYVDGDLEFARAAAAFEDDTLTPSAVGLLKFLNEFRTYAVTYVRGRELAAAYLAAHAGADDSAGRWRAYVQLVTNPDQLLK